MQPHFQPTRVTFRGTQTSRVGEPTRATWIDRRCHDLRLRTDQRRHLVQRGADSSTATPNVWTGDLYVYRGPWFGTTPLHSRRSPAPQGRDDDLDCPIRHFWQSTYTVDGVTINKNLQRASFVTDNFSGHYGGGLHQDATGCFNPAFNGTVEDARNTDYYAKTGKRSQ